MKLLLLAVISVFVFPFNVFGYTVDCTGYNSDTGSYVYGECNDGDFDGHDSSTGNYVYGDCEDGGDLEGYDSETGQYVYGDCDDC